MSEATPVANPPANDESFAAIYQAAKRDVREGDALEAMVVEIDGNRVSLDAGLKSLSRVQLEEFRDDNGDIPIKKNDFVTVKVELLDDGRGNTSLSHLQYRRDLAWKKLVEAAEKKETIQGIIRERVKGGYSVHIDGLRTFLPGSLVDLFPSKREDPALIGRTETFYIERVKHESKSAILNRRMVRERELAGFDFDNITIKEGEVFTGKVVATVDHPEQLAFIHIGDGIHGRMHRDEVSWNRIVSLSDTLAIDQEIEVVVLSIDKERKIIELSAKRLIEDPWKQLEKSYPYGARIFGKVTSIKDYGAFVEIEKGIEGLVHTSELDWMQQRHVQTSNYLKVGDEVEVMMLECNKEARRISLSLKQCKANPWEEFNVTYRNGSKLRGKVVSLDANLGLFVELPGGLTGLVHITNLTYAENRDEELAKYSKGDEIDVYLIGVDPKAQRVSLGIKQLSPDPFEVYQEKARTKEPLTATVNKLFDKSARVKFADGLEAILSVAEVKDEHVDNISDELKEGQEIQVVVIKIEKGHENKKRNIIVSMRAVGKTDARKDSIAAHTADPKAAEVDEKKRSSFGAMVKDTLGMEGSSSEAAASSDAQTQTEATATESETVQETAPAPTTAEKES